MSDYLNFLQQQEDTALVKTILLVEDSADVRYEPAMIVTLLFLSSHFSSALGIIRARRSSL
jgi:hypothetical protein